MARILLRKGYVVVGTTRNLDPMNLWRLERLGIRESVSLVSSPEASKGLISDLLGSVAPDEIYHLGGPSSVASSFREPREAMTEIYGSLVQFLEVLRENRAGIHFFYPSSVDCYGNQSGVELNEDSAHRPLSPYAVAKSSGFFSVKNYRDGFGVWAATGILTNHESPLRGPGFFAHDVISGLKRVKKGLEPTVRLGNLDGGRDWMWAGDTAEAIYLIATATRPDDYLVASGRTVRLSDFVRLACEMLELDYERVVRFNPTLERPRDIGSLRLSATKFKESFNWSPSVDVERMIDFLIRDETN